MASVGAQDPAVALPARQAWLMAARPRTLPVSVGPVLVGTAVAFAEDGLRVLPALMALAGALLLQIGSNFANDVFDFEKGADGADRIGPPRATQLRALTPSQMRRGMVLVLAGAAAVGLYLVWVGGWPIAVAGALSIVAAVTYSGSPWPFGYRGIGDPAVFVFFGVIAVVGTTWVQTGGYSTAALAASLPVGALATAILVVNNTRDIAADSRAGKRTIAVRLGRAGAVKEYRALVLGAFVVLPFYAIAGFTGWAVLAPLVLLPAALRLARVVATHEDGPTLNEALAGTARLGFGFCVLFAAGWAIG